MSASQYTHALSPTKMEHAWIPHVPQTKRPGQIKRHECADGRLQQIWTNKEETASPTESTKSLVLLKVKNSVR